MKQDDKNFQPDHAGARNSARFWIDGKYPERPKSAFEFTNLSACYLELSDALKVVHAVRYASQPYVYFYCGGEAIYAGAAKQVKEGVFEMEEGSYTFEDGHITCADCLKKLRDSPKERFARWLVEHSQARFRVEHGADVGDPTIVKVFTHQKGDAVIKCSGKDADEAFGKVMKELDERFEKRCARLEEEIAAKKAAQRGGT